MVITELKEDRETELKLEALFARHSV